MPNSRGRGTGVAPGSPARHANLWIGLGMVGAVLLGFVLGRASVEPPAPVSTPQPAPRVAVREIPARHADDDALTECRQQLAVASGLLLAQERAKLGDPVAFPADVPPQYRSDRFEQEVRDALADCPDAELELAHVDCSEFPCMAFFAQPEGSMAHAVYALRRCDAWKERFEGSNMSTARFRTTDGYREWSMVGPSPDSEVTTENKSVRWNLRRDEGKQVLMDAWGGYELTRLEALDEQIGFFRAEGNQDMVERLEAKRAKLVEAGEP